MQNNAFWETDIQKVVLPCCLSLHKLDNWNEFILFIIIYENVSARLALSEQF